MENSLYYDSQKKTIWCCNILKQHQIVNNIVVEFMVNYQFKAFLSIWMPKMRMEWCKIGKNEKYV